MAHINNFVTILSRLWSLFCSGPPLILLQRRLWVPLVTQVEAQVQGPCLASLTHEWEAPPLLRGVAEVCKLAHVSWVSSTFKTLAIIFAWISIHTGKKSGEAKYVMTPEKKLTCLLCCELKWGELEKWTLKKNCWIELRMSFRGKWSESCSAVPNSLWGHGLPSQWNSPVRILEWVMVPFSKGSSQPKDWTQVSHIAGGFFTSWATREAQIPWKSNLIKFNEPWLSMFCARL